MIPDDLRRKLIEALLSIGVIADGTANDRAALLAGIPGREYIARSLAVARGDVIAMIGALEDSFGPGGEWRLLQLVDNAAGFVPGAAVGHDLEVIRAQLLAARQGAQPTRLGPEEVAQPHLLDLHKPVWECVAQLFDPCMLQGFVLHTASARVVQNFCKSLRHRGVGARLWERGTAAEIRFVDQVQPIICPVGSPQGPAGSVLASVGRVRERLAARDVVWPLLVDQRDDADAIWGGIRGALPGPLPHRLIVVFGLPDGVEHPPETKPLAPVVFTPADVERWLDAIAEAARWNRAGVAHWGQAIVGPFAGHPNGLPPDVVYDRLDGALDVLRDRPTEEEFTQRLAAL